jgi:tetratricopeptide (TPR) repeat protein
MMGDFTKAEQPLEMILDEFPDDIGAMNDLGYLWADQNKNLKLALDMIQKAVASDPDNRAYRDSLGWVYYRLGRFADAITELEEAIKPEPDAEPGDDGPDGVILDHLADAYAAAGRKDDARKFWQRAEKSFEKQADKEKLDAVRKKLAK